MIQTIQCLMSRCSVRTAAVEFVATAASMLPPADVYALLLPTVASALAREPASLASQQVQPVNC